MSDSFQIGSHSDWRTSDFAPGHRLSLAAGLAAAGLLLGFLGNGVTLLVASAMLLAAVWALAKAADERVIEASRLAAADPAWRPHVAELCAFPLTFTRF